MLQPLLVRLPSVRMRLFAFVVLTLMIGMIFYHTVEGWSWVDSLYFCVIMLTTIGYGDLHPTQDVSKLFTVVYIFLGLGLIAGIIADIGQRRLEAIRRLPERTRPLPDEQPDLKE